MTDTPRNDVRPAGEAVALELIDRLALDPEHAVPQSFRISCDHGEAGTCVVEWQSRATISDGELRGIMQQAADTDSR